MYFVSTREQADAVTISKAMLNGLCPDGGLYVPEKFPKFDLKNFLEITSFSEATK